MATGPATMPLKIVCPGNGAESLASLKLRLFPTLRHDMQCVTVMPTLMRNDIPLDEAPHAYHHHH